MKHLQKACVAAFVAVLSYSACALAAVGDNPSRLKEHSDRKVLYGELHLHTSFSIDSYVLGPREIDPDLAYRFARGEPVRYGDHDVKRRWPLDFAAVTDHGEYLGTLHDLDDPGSALSKTQLGRSIRRRDMAAMTRLWKIFEGQRLPEINQEQVVAAWQKEIDAANENYEPGKFTTLIGYEWTSWGDTRANGGQVNLHRNVIFRGDTAPVPFTAVDSIKPEDLWAYLEINRRRGIEALAIPHNPNGSHGLMYDWNDSQGTPISKDYAALRAFNEPLAEIYQAKGQSETHPLLAPSDEFAGFEVRSDFWGPSANGKGKDGHGSSIREAYGRGLIMAEKLGVNPFKFGVVGGSDFHNGLTTSDENAYSGLLDGAHGGIDPTQDYYLGEIRQKLLVAVPATLAEDSAGDLESGSAGLTGVWAEENTRGSIYDALRRKETFATSGPRLKLRFFGGWHYPRNLLTQSDWVRSAYAQGVAMGSDLPAKPARARAPRFIVWAVKDPDSGNLDRVQIVKVWAREGQQHEKIIDVALSDNRHPDPKTGKVPAVGNTVDLKTATYTNSIGVVELSAVWEDPQFDPTESAAYYVRVIEIPTPRWTTIRAVQAGVPLPPGVPATIQERGWTSPIWYEAPAHVKDGHASE